MEIRTIIESGLLETYVMGIASEEEKLQVEQLSVRYPEFKEALTSLELDMELLAQRMAVPPPPLVFDKIEQEINEIKLRDQHLLKIDKPVDDQKERQSTAGGYIEVESSSSHMRIHKAWRWVFAAVFILGKIFLGFAIYYYLESRQAKEKIEELKQEIRKTTS
ncbi:hypothetical protein [Pedobacter sp.]|uniref:hypothetical protein n=1 Tax=Pedobacter sp. TaxID=1411316 RepID=UPI003BACD4D7